MQFLVPDATLQAINEYLKSDQAYTLHKSARRRSTWNNIYVNRIYAQWQADVADMQFIAKHNNEIR